MQLHAYKPGVETTVEKVQGDVHQKEQKVGATERGKDPSTSIAIA